MIDGLPGNTFHGTKPGRTHLHAAPTLDAPALIDFVDLPLSTGNGANRTGLQTQHACLTLVFLDTVGDE